jgi:hypothetical protein
LSFLLPPPVELERICAIADQLPTLSGDPAAYRSWAEGYYERDVRPEPVAHVLAGRPLDAAILKQLKCERTLDELAEDLAEISYGRPAQGCTSLCKNLRRMTLSGLVETSDERPKHGPCVRGSCIARYLPAPAPLSRCTP